MSLTGKRCLVTGAGGFIGSHLIERLVHDGAHARGLVHYNALGSRGWLERSELLEQVEVVAGDVTDAGSIRRAMKDVDIVFHLASLVAIPYSYIAPESYVRTNVTGTLNILEGARSENVSRVVHTSTSEVYGTAVRVPIDEGHPLQGQSPYSATKIAADKLAEAFYRSFELPVVTIRPFNTYGPRQSARAVIPTIITQCLRGDIIELGSVDPTRDFNYVADTVDGFTRAATAPDVVGETINLGSGSEVGIADVVRRVAEIVGIEPNVVEASPRIRPGKSEVRRLLADNTRARTLLGWESTIGLDEGLRRTVEWIRVNIDSYREGEYTI